MACFVRGAAARIKAAGRRRCRRSLCCAVAALVLSAGCATDLSRDRLATEYFNLGTGYLELGEPERAAGYLERALELQPDAAAARFNLAVALMELDQAAAAAPHLDLLLAADPENVRVLELQAANHQRRGRSGDALVVYGTLLRLQPQHPAARYNAAILLWSLGEADAAAAELRALLLHDSDDHEARYNLGLLLAEQGSPEEAAEVLAAYLEAVPGDIDALLTLAGVETRRHRYAAALHAYDDAAALLPAADSRQVELAFERAVILLTAVQDPGAGLAALAQALEAGFRDRERLAALLAEEHLVRRDGVLALIRGHLPEAAPEQPP